MIPWSYLSPSELDALRDLVLPWLNTPLTIRRRQPTYLADGTVAMTWTEMPAIGFVTPRRSINNPKAVRDQETFNVDVWVYLAHPTTVDLGDGIVAGATTYTVVFVRPPNPLFQLVGVTVT